jgi:hypothetical protein
MSQDKFREKVGGEMSVFGRSSNGGFWLEKVKCFIVQGGLTDTLSATALFSSVSDRSNRQQNNERDKGCPG